VLCSGMPATIKFSIACAPRTVPQQLREATGLVFQSVDPSSQTASTRVQAHCATACSLSDNICPCVERGAEEKFVNFGLGLIYHYCRLPTQETCRRRAVSVPGSMAFGESAQLDLCLEV
jgi:hypothetical protein